MITTMSLRRSLLSRRISGRSFALSKSLKEHKTLEAGAKPIGDGKDDGEEVEPEFDGVCWSTMQPELLGEIIRRVEASEDRWPVRRNVVACACVCKRWREVTKEIVRSPLHSGKITFPSNLKQSGTRDSPLQCLIRRNKKNSTFYLYLGLTQSFTDKGKLLLAARSYRHGARTEYIISLDADDISQGSNSYVGKLSSDFLGTNFTIYDSQPPYSGAKPMSSKSGRRFARKQISPQVLQPTLRLDRSPTSLTS